MARYARPALVGPTAKTRHEGEHAVETSEVQDRLVDLEERVRLLEDQLAIHRLVNTWGPAVDGDNPDAAAAIWTEDGILLSDMKGTFLDGPAAVAAMVRGGGHQELIHRGSAHIQSFPLVSVDGDEATAIGYSRVYLHNDGGGYEVWRVSANRWDFRRTPNGWRVARRVNQVIDGGPKAREVLNQAFD
jgi:ketosteroid isomerase-like protein